MINFVLIRCSIIAFTSLIDSFRIFVLEFVTSALEPVNIMNIVVAGVAILMDGSV